MSSVWKSCKGWKRRMTMAAHEHMVTEKHREMFAEMLKEGTDPISFWCDVLSDESAPMWARKEAATELKATVYG
jgi:hypothetical protein